MPGQSLQLPFGMLAKSGRDVDLMAFDRDLHGNLLQWQAGRYRPVSGPSAVRVVPECFFWILLTASTATAPGRSRRLARLPFSRAGNDRSMMEC